MEKYYTPQEAAEKFNMTERTLKDWLRAGKVKGEKVGRSWRVAESALKTYLRLPVELEKVDRRYVQKELEKLQTLLLEIDKDTRDGMEKSEALKIVADIEDLIQKADFYKPLSSTGQKMTLKGSYQPVEERIICADIPDVEELIDELVNDLLEGETYISLDDIAVIEGTIKSKLKPLSRRAERDLKELVEIAQKFSDNKNANTMTGAYRLASALRRVEENLH